MNQKLLDYIRHLSKTDKKSLSEKALKTAEEVGELAKVVLPYVSAYATNHRFVEKERILEESVDTILCALSVAYDLDFTDEEVETMMKLKSEKWAKLQKGEVDLKYPIPFEIHITVANDEQDACSVDYFRNTCVLVGVKPILLDLQSMDGTITKDVMTSSTHFGTNTTAYAEAQRVVSLIRLAGLNVVRTKIETVPWHPAAPKWETDTMPENCYFEAHIPVIMQPDRKSALEYHLSLWNRGTNPRVHMSQNAFKKHADGSVTIMLTYRTTTAGVTPFDEAVNRIIASVSMWGNTDHWSVGKVHKEFSIYDTKMSHDAEWLLGVKQ